MLSIILIKDIYLRKVPEIEFNKRLTLEIK